MAGKRAPAHLKPATRAWWRSVVRDFDLEEHHRRLLTMACEAWDRAQQARELIDREGLTVADRFGQMKAHPAAQIERDSRIVFARLLRELDLDVDTPAATPRAPGLRRYD